MQATAVSPALADFLWRESHAQRSRFANLLLTPNADGSLGRDAIDPTPDEWTPEAEFALALGVPQEGTRPEWVVARFGASGYVDPPPLDREGRLPVFTAYRYAQAAAARLAELGHHDARAVPVWPSYVQAQLQQRGDSATGLRRFHGGVDDSGTTLPEWLPSLVRGFVRERGAPGWAGYTG